MKALCGICDRPAVAEIAPGKPVCSECLALPVHERRLAGLRRLQADEQAIEPFWHLLSFADERGFLGACWVKARGTIDACTVARSRGCNPGGGVKCWPLPQYGEPPVGSAYVLHVNKEDVDRLLKQWTTRIN